MSRLRINKSRIANASIYLFLGVFALADIYPLYFSLISSLKSNSEIFQSFTSLPTQFKFENYVTAWRLGNIGRYTLNTFFLTAASLILTAIFGAMASYALSKFVFKARGIFHLFFIAGMMIPIQAIIIPLAYLFGMLGGMNNYPMLILLYTAFNIPLTILILANYMREIPAEIEEAIIMDGGSTLQVLRYVIFPLSLPAIASVTIFNFIQVWNNLIFPLVFITEKKLGTITMGLLAFFGERSNDYGTAMAAIFLTMLPTLFIYVFFQEKLEKGMASGAVKG
ncbi:carbohydrate ABC transporter permease [Cohnella cellulosilytica]|uniref:Carbohydrate ABC transporter permease n=1 Tax=Cohnella cellulosilytica TaxID=986710 RepID=A0ABW2F936_9BACL